MQQYSHAWARRVTIGGSADDAGIGDLNIRQVLILNPHENYESDIFSWFSKNYPGVVTTGVTGNTPDELAMKVKQALGV